MKKLVIILPAFNEEKVIGQVLEGLKEELENINSLKKEIVVVDDESRDKTAKIASGEGAVVLQHPINRGLGGALATGLEYAKRKNFDFAVTFDADGQHDPKDLRKILETLLSGEEDVVIGVRDLKNLNNFPFPANAIDCSAEARMCAWREICSLLNFGPALL